MEERMIHGFFCHLCKGLVSSLFFLSTAASDVSLTLTLTPGVLVEMMMIMMMNLVLYSSSLCHEP